MSVPDIVLFPHCDLHVALNGAPNLLVRVALRSAKPAGDPDPLSFNLTPIPLVQCHFDFFAPNAATGHRLDNLPTVNDQTGVVTANTPGVYLFQLRFGIHSLVGRLQVHNQILGWWFGNSSITTARDPRFAHAQPSIYASFTNENTVTDIVGDITGHGYVPLTSTNPARFTVNADGRLQGVSETDDGSAQVSGTFLGVTHDIPVRVVDYGKARNELDVVRTGNVAGAPEMHNLLFIAEGFRKSGDDEKLFNKVVTKVVDEMFDKPRHQPYGLLEKSFNVWKAYAPSQQHAVTCAFRVNDSEVPGKFVKGFPIPYDGPVSKDKNAFTVEELVRRVGLPLNNDGRTLAVLGPLWRSQSLLTDVDAAEVNEELVTAWKVQLSSGILEARDTFLGFRLGARPGDRISRGSPVDPPAQDNPNDANLKPFIARVYEFFKVVAPRTVQPDPRRHPPELFAGGAEENPGYAILRYISSLRTRSAPNANIGQEWQPDPAGAFKRSRGLIVVVVNDALDGGTNICDNTMTVATLAEFTNVSFVFAVNGNERIMRRTTADPVRHDLDSVVNTVTHELGHSFNLDDEYEESGGNDPNANRNRDFIFDNTARLGGIFLHGVVQPNDTVQFQDDLIDPGRVKWFDLMRMQASARLTADAVAAGGGVKVTIKTPCIAAFVAAKKKGLQPFLRAEDLSERGRQLPLKADNAHFLQALAIGDIDEAQGTVVVTGAGLPAIGSPVFKKGAVLFVPKRKKQTDPPALVVEGKVLDHIKAHNTPLNKNTDTIKKNDEEDEPVDIDGFRPPCKAYKVIGVYEGAAAFAGRNYRPAGLCKMRKTSDAGKGDGEFCHVCKWLIVNRVDPSLHATLDKKFYPRARKGGNG